MTAQATSARGAGRGAPGRPARRRRDPDRKERILVAAAALGARRGFDAISMADIGAIQSTLFFRSGLADERLTELLESMAHSCLGTDPVPTSELSLTK